MKTPIGVSEQLAAIFSYYNFRGLLWPSAADARRFYQCEVSELMDIAIRIDGLNWVRNSASTGDQMQKLRYEIGDCYMMFRVWQWESLRREPEMNLFKTATEISLKGLKETIDDLYPGSGCGVFKARWNADSIPQTFERLAQHHGLNPYQCMIDKFQSKGWNADQFYS